MPPEEEDTAKSPGLEPPPAEELDSSVATDAATKTNVDGDARGPATTATASAANVPHKLTPSERDRAVSSLRTLLTFKTVSATAPSDGEYVRCADHLLSELRSVGCFDLVQILDESPPDCPVVARWPGTEPNVDELPVLLLNGHYDVVPASMESESGGGGGWTVPPFEGILRDGKIYGRGAQDMKCVCVQYVEAVRKLSSVGFAPRRHVYLSFVPDEEVGGAGMAAFLDSKLYRSLPAGIALALDEGLASETDTFSVFYGERLPWWIDVTARGNTGHGSRFIESTAVEQLLELCNRAAAFRSGQRDLLHGVGCATHENCSHAIAAKNRAVAAARKRDGSSTEPLKLGDVTSLNVTTLRAGVRVGDTYAYNVVPPEATASLDIRISPHVPPADVKDMIDSWCRECAKPPAGSLEWGFVHDNGNDDSIGHNVTSTDRRVNPWYGAFADAMGIMGLDFVPEVFPAATDSRFLRALGVRAIGFSPMRNSEILLHENDEYVKESVFLEGVEIMTGLIEALASRGPEVDELAKSVAEGGGGEN